jgi:outer membrane protein assembly factor BamE (lipoprotein component of BamABCDE complex)
MKIKTVQILFSLSLVIAVAGCSTTPEQSRPETEPPKAFTDTRNVTGTNYVTMPAKLEDLQTRYGLSLHDAQDKALKLEPGMTQDDVILLLGKPDETSAGTYGTQTVKPWNGITWYYRWGTNLLNSKVLNISFEKSSDAWVVNSWQWGGFGGL